MNVSTIIVNYNGLHYTRQCLETLFQYHDSKTIEVIVVDNNSTDGSQKELPQLFPSINLITLPDNKGFGVANNIGAAASKNELLFFVNNDTIFKEEVLTKLAAELMENEKCGIVGPKLLNEDETYQHSFGEFPTILSELSSKRLANDYSLQVAQEATTSISVKKDWVTAAAFMLKRNLFEIAGGFDEKYFMYFEDIDLCKTLQGKGYHCRYVPSVSIVHLGGKSYTKKNDKILYEYRRSQLRYYDKHNSLFQRIAVRKYIAIKFLPKLFKKTDRSFWVKVMKLLFSNHN